jgi:hypothetical protein
VRGGEHGEQAEFIMVKAYMVAYIERKGEDIVYLDKARDPITVLLVTSKYRLRPEFIWLSATFGFFLFFFLLYLRF